MSTKPNILFVMTDQQRFDSIAALGNSNIYTPNLDRLVARGVSFSNAYSPCPVCVAARYVVRTGCLPPTTRVFSNTISKPALGQDDSIVGRCGNYIAQEMASREYRTFGIGKFHTQPWDENLGYQSYLRSEELYANPDQRQNDDFAQFIAEVHPEYKFIEALMGERTEMYYMPQMSALPEECTVESWVADRAVERIRFTDNKPFFGFVSFIGPHPPFAPPVPFNRMYDPDRMPSPVRGDINTDHMDEQIRWMNHAIWADDISDSHARVLRARYYGELSFIDKCLGRIIDAVEDREDAENTLICFFSDHGDHMGDHSAWQKESFFDVSCRVPFLLSWPREIPQGVISEAFVGLEDLFGVATNASGNTDCREGDDILSVINGGCVGRENYLGIYGQPGTSLFKCMIRSRDWKYIFMANGGLEQLFNISEDPNEIDDLSKSKIQLVKEMRDIAVSLLKNSVGAEDAIESNDLRVFDSSSRPLERIYQFDRSRGINNFPRYPSDCL